MAMQLRSIDTLHVGDVFLYGDPLVAYQLTYLDPTDGFHKASVVACEHQHTAFIKHFMHNTNVIVSGIPDDGR